MSGSELAPAIQYLIAFLVIFALLALFALILRRMTGRQLWRSSSSSSERGRLRQPRLGVVDIYDFDSRHKLVLVRRDNVEHLLLFGASSDVVIETNIVRSSLGRPSSNEQEERAFEPSSVRPVIDAAKELPQKHSEPETIADLPEIVQPQPVLHRKVPAAPSPMPKAPSNVEPKDIKPTVVEKRHQPEPSISAPVKVERPVDTARQRPVTTPLPPPPPVTTPAPAVLAPAVLAPSVGSEVIEDAVFIEDANDSIHSSPSQPEASKVEPPVPEKTTLEPVTPSPAKPVKSNSDDILSDMARQLEDALRKPLASVKPSPTAIARQAKEKQNEPAASTVIKPVEAKIAEAPPKAPEASLKPDTSPAAEPLKVVDPSSLDPFSVEDIEAEFARLLGRNDLKS